MDNDHSKIITQIKENYASLEKGIVNQLYFEAEHGATIGHYREKIWAEMFKRIVPRKFVVEQSVFLFLLIRGEKYQMKWIWLFLMRCIPRIFSGIMI